jgi:hypothetical protein
MNPDISNTAAPADAAPHRRWPAWQKVVAYLIFAAIASASIWYVDRDAMRAQAAQDRHARVPRHGEEREISHR